MASRNFFSLFRLNPVSLRTVVLLACLSFSASTWAQQVDSTVTRRFQLADSYLRAGQFERAIHLLEDLYAGYPETFVFFDKLKEAYESIKRYDDAISLVEDRIERTARDPILVAEIARLHYLKGNEESADKIWQDALSLAPDNRNTYRIVYQSLYESRLLERAIDVLEQGEKRLGADAHFEPDLAYLYSQTGKHAKAMEKYIALLEQNDRQIHYVKGRLNRFLEQDEAAQASISVAERAVRRDPLNRAFREILAWLYIEAGDFDKALDASRAIDRLEGEDGRVLFAFAETAASAEAFEAALKAYDEILIRYPNSPSASEALLGLGVMHESWGREIGERAYDESGNRTPAPHFEKAMESYRSFLQQYPDSPFYAEVLRRIGTLQRDVFFDLGRAEQTLNEVITRYSDNERASAQAEFDLGRIALLRGELDDARFVFSRLIERIRTGELAERARFELALIHFYRGEFDAATTLTEVLDENTSTDVANDAIELKLLIFENKGPDSLNTPLKKFAHAHLLDRRRQYESALSELDSIIAQLANHQLADDVRFLRASVLRKMGRPAEAVEAFGEIPLMFRNSFLADRSIFLMGQILEYDLGDKERALEAYNRLLTEYPGSLQATEARTRIRALRGDGI